MAIFSIKDIEAVSGIRCHTLRIWEQRYGILAPKRTDSNIRFYDDEDLKCILNISILNKNGYKISEIAKLEQEEIQELVLQLSHKQSNYTCQVNELLSSMIAYDEFAFNTSLSRSVLQMGLEQAMLQVVFPFLNEIGIMWQVGSIHPSHEHFATNIIKQKLYVAIDGNLGRYVENRKRFLLFLPENEQHSLGLLFANYLLRARGHDVLFLGQEIPMKSFQDAIGGYKPDYVFSILMASHSCMDKQEFVSNLSSIWPDAKLLLTGIQFLQCDNDYPENVRIIRRIEEFIEFANTLTTLQGSQSLLPA
jgi:MerR family transcriptional regulator, light-induced transcriptional regulator